MKKRVDKVSFDNKKISWKVISFVALILVAVSIYFFVAGNDDPKNLIPSESSLTGKAIYYAPFTTIHLRDGVALDAGYNRFVWTNEVGELPLTEAFSSILDNLIYVYDFNDKTFWFNPKEKFGYLNNHNYYKTKLTNVVKPGHMYMVYMKAKDVLTYNIVKKTTIILPDGTKIVPDDNEVICVNSEEIISRETAKCEDSDGGLNYGVKGNVIGNRLNEETGRESLDDLVVISPTEAKIKFEGHDWRLYNLNQEYEVDGAFKFKITYITFISLNNSNNEIKVVYTSIGDYCVDGAILNEFYCEDDFSDSFSGLSRSNFYTCPNGCSNGACVSSVSNATCTDSDGGLNYGVFGSVNQTYMSKNFYNQDVCVDGFNIKEFYCDPSGNYNDIDYDLEPCPNGCKNGACVQGNATGGGGGGSGNSSTNSTG